MNRDQVKGAIDEVLGSARRAAGELTGSTRLQVKGMAQQVKGKVEGAWGDAKDALREAVENTEIHIDTHVKFSRKNPSADSERTNNSNTRKP
jgi:uncharacterized protein YjbJ (UPF0337 family)